MKKYRVKCPPQKPEKYYKERGTLGYVSSGGNTVVLPKGTKAIRAEDLTGDECWEVHLECLGEETEVEIPNYDKRMKQYEKDLKEYREYEKVEEERLRTERRRLYNELKEEFGE